MLTADTDLNIGPDAATSLHTDLHQFTDTVEINAHKRIFRPDLPLQIVRQKVGVIARQAKCGLRQVSMPLPVARRR